MQNARLEDEDNENGKDSDLIPCDEHAAEKATESLENAPKRSAEEEESLAKTVRTKVSRLSKTALTQEGCFAEFADIQNKQQEREQKFQVSTIHATM